MFKVSCIDQLDRRIKPESVFSQSLFQDQNCGQHGCSRSQCKGCDSRSGCGGNTEEIDKNPFIAGGVLIKEDAYSVVVAQRLQNVPPGLPSINRNISAKGSIVHDQFFNFRVI